jgi:SAM-dependent methyltransferase
MAAPARQNVAQREGERWRPPSLEPRRTPLGRLAAGVRRFFDLQAGSVWKDVAENVASARGKVVDVGCGAQPYRELFPAETTYVGLDVDEAEAHFGYAVPDTIHFDGGAWPAETGQADLVLCTEVLEHVLDPRALLAEAHRALRPGGRLLLTVPFAARWHFVPHDYWRFTPASLKHLLEEAGFRDLVVWARGNEITVACYKVMALLLPLLMPQGASTGKTMALRLVGLPTVPFFVALAGVANLSLRGRGGDDCLGYTVTAARPEEAR